MEKGEGYRLALSVTEDFSIIDCCITLKNNAAETITIEHFIITRNRRRKVTETGHGEKICE